MPAGFGRLRAHRPPAPMADQDTTFRLLVDDQGTPALKAFGAEAARVLGAEKELAAAGKTIGKDVAGGVSLAKPEVVKLAKETEAAGGAARDAGGKFVAAGGEIGKAMGTASREVGGFGRVAELALGMSLGQVGAQAINRFREGVAGAVDVGATFEQQLADMSAITGIAGADLDKLGQAARDAAVETGVGASEQVEAMKLLASNIDVATMGGTAGLAAMGREVVTLSVAAGTDLALAADAVAGAINQFGLEADQASRVVNVLAAGAKAGAAEVPDLAAAMGAAGVTAAAAGVSIEQATGAIEILAQSTVKGAEAGTGLRNVLTIMQTETDKLAKYGITGLNVKTDGLTKTLERLAPLLGNATAIADVFGRENLNVAQILIKNAGAVDAMTAAVTGTNTAQEQAEIQMSTLKGSVTLLKTALEELALNGYEGLGGAARDVINATRDTVVWLDKNWDSVETGTKVLALAGVAYGAFRAAALLASAETQAMILTDGIAAAAKVGFAGATGVATGALRTFTAAVMANPLGLLLVALSTAVGAWVLFGDGAERAAQRSEDAMTRVRNAANEARNAILQMNAADAQAARAGADEAKVAGLARMNSLYSQIVAKERELADARAHPNTSGPPGAAGWGSLMDSASLERDLARLRRELEVARVQLNEAGQTAEAAQGRLNSLAEMSAASAPAPAVAATADKPKQKGKTDAEREAEREAERRRTAAEQQRRDDEQAARDTVELAAQTAAEREAIRVAEAGQEAALRQQDARAEARAAADRIALMTDEFARRRATLDDAAARRQTDYDVQTAEIERVAQAERAAIDVTYNTEEARINKAKEDKTLSRAEIARLDAQLAQADAARDHTTTDTENRRRLAARQAREENSDAESAAAAERRKLAEDEAKHAEEEAQKSLARMFEQEALRQRIASAAKANAEEAERARVERHRAQMQRIQEQADAVLAAVGLAAMVTASASARHRAELDAEYDDQTHRRDAAQDAELGAMQARVDAERGVVDERTDLEKQLDARKAAIAKGQQAADLAYRKKAAQMDREAQLAERRYTLFQLAITTALNIAKAFPNPFAIAAAVALGATQAAGVLGQPLPAIPQYALGTDRAPGGLALVGERGPELVNIPGGSSVITNGRTERLASSLLALERSQGARAPQVIVQQMADPAHAAALAALRRDAAAQTTRLEAGLASVERATREIDFRIDGLELSRGLRRVEAREAAAGNTRTR